LAPEPNSREAGTRFEDEVAETFEPEKRPTLRRVDRFGTDSLHDVDGRDLGDLDVIALPSLGRLLFRPPAHGGRGASIGPRLDRRGQSPRRS
jgi:hypothetical protein